MLDRYERDEVAFVRETVTSGARVVDIGANIGFYTALFGILVGPTGHVLACEPLDAVADALEHTVAENDFADRVTVYRLALDAEPGTVLLRHAPFTVNEGAAYLAPHTALPPEHVDVSVQTKMLDDIVGNGPCAFVKLDSEGAELRILAGASNTLTHCRPIILAELNPTLLDRVGQNRPTDVIAKMSAFGYTTRLLTGGPKMIDRYDDAASINVVFSPPAAH